MRQPLVNLSGKLGDYRKALRILQRDPQDVLAWDTKREVEEFFLSGWFELLTDVDGEYLIRKLREEVYYAF